LLGFREYDKCFLLLNEAQELHQKEELYSGKNYISLLILSVAKKYLSCTEVNKIRVENLSG